MRKRAWIENKEKGVGVLVEYEYEYSLIYGNRSRINILTSMDIKICKRDLEPFDFKIDGINPNIITIDIENRRLVRVSAGIRVEFSTRPIKIVSLDLKDLADMVECLDKLRELKKQYDNLKKDVAIMETIVNNEKVAKERYKKLVEDLRDEEVEINPERIEILSKLIG